MGDTAVFYYEITCSRCGVIRTLYLDDEISARQLDEIRSNHHHDGRLI